MEEKKGHEKSSLVFFILLFVGMIIFSIMITNYQKKMEEEKWIEKHAIEYKYIGPYISKEHKNIILTVYIVSNPDPSHPRVIPEKSGVPMTPDRFFLSDTKKKGISFSPGDLKEQGDKYMLITDMGETIGEMDKDSGDVKLYAYGLFKKDPEFRPHP